MSYVIILFIFQGYDLDALAEQQQFLAPAAGDPVQTEQTPPTQTSTTPTPLQTVPVQPSGRLIEIYVKTVFCKVETINVCV